MSVDTLIRNVTDIPSGEEIMCFSEKQSIKIEKKNRKRVLLEQKPMDGWMDTSVLHSGWTAALLS